MLVRYMSGLVIQLSVMFREAKHLSHSCVYPHGLPIKIRGIHKVKQTRNFKVINIIIVTTSSLKRETGKLLVAMKSTNFELLSHLKLNV